MTTDNLTAALVAMLEASKPDASIQVADARSLEGIALPTIAVDCQKPEIHSAAIPGVFITPVSIVLRSHAGDGGRDALKSWAASIEALLGNSDIMRDYITASGNSIRCDYIVFPSGGTGWDDKIFEATFSGEAWVARA